MRGVGGGIVAGLGALHDALQAFPYTPGRYAPFLTLSLSHSPSSDTAVMASVR